MYLWFLAHLTPSIFPRNANLDFSVLSENEQKKSIKKTKQTQKRKNKTNKRHGYYVSENIVTQNRDNFSIIYKLFWSNLSIHC